MEKLCTKCGFTKPKIDFAKAAKRKDGLNGWCRACMAADYRAKREQRLADSKEDYRKRFAANPERERALRTKWRDTNRELQNQSVANWKKRNLDRHATYERNRRALKKGCEGRHTHEDVVALFNKQKGECYYCTDPLSDGYHVDHKTALAKGGSNGPENIALACPPCNLRKGILSAAEFSLKLGGQNFG
jgi:5-methylcytosine-specific restriction endonuclease McrA